MELDPSSPLPRDAHSPDTERAGLDTMELVKMDEGKETGIRGRLEEDEAEDEDGGGPLELLTSSRMGNVSAIESSQMFVSLLAEGSSIRYDSSMQVCENSLIREDLLCSFCIYHCILAHMTDLIFMMDYFFLMSGGQWLQHNLSRHCQPY